MEGGGGGGGGGLSANLKAAAVLWVEGFRQACCLHRVLILCRRSRKLLIRTGQCFLLNGFIFLGSIIVLYSFLIPALYWILPDICPQFTPRGVCSFTGILKFYSYLRHGLIHLFYVTWLYPLYVFSIILSNIWYNDIAKYGFSAMGNPVINELDPVRQSDASTIKNYPGLAQPTDLGWVLIGIGEQVYSVLLLSCFFLEVYVTGFIPYVGKALNFLLFSWMYAYYCFEYKWNFSGISLDKRLNLFESNWAFFAGFGSPCVLPLFFFSPLVSYGCMAILFPLFVLAATGSEAEQLISSQRTRWGDACFERLQIFKFADTLSLIPPTNKATNVWHLVSNDVSGEEAEHLLERDELVVANSVTIKETSAITEVYGRRTNSANLFIKQVKHGLKLTYGYMQSRYDQSYIHQQYS